MERSYAQLVGLRACLSVRQTSENWMFAAVKCLSSASRCPQKLAQRKESTWRRPVAGTQPHSHEHGGRLLILRPGDACSGQCGQAGGALLSSVLRTTLSICSIE